MPSADGNDFVTAGTRYVSGLQSLLIVNAQKNAKAEVAAGINDAYAVPDAYESYNMMQREPTRALHARTPSAASHGSTSKAPTSRNGQCAR